MNNKILLSSPTMHQEEMEFIQEAFVKNWIAPLGFNCDGFETEMQEYLGIASNKELGAAQQDKQYYPLCLVSGTAALHLAVKLAGVKRGDIVLCSDMTFAATVNPVSYEGGIQVFIDSEYQTWNMDPIALDKAFAKYPQAKAVVLAHLYGTPAQMNEILAVCDKHNAVLIEDAAEALSATYKGQKCGTFGQYNVFSFNGNKIITTSGGGMLITCAEDVRKKALFWATQARDAAPWYQHSELGYNYRMSNIVAGIGRGQLKHLEEHKILKEKIYQRYKEGLKGLPLTMNPYLQDSSPNFWLSCILLDKGCRVKPMAIYEKLKEANIESRPIWKPMHLQPLFADCDYITANNEDVGGDIFARGLCLASDIKMTEAQQAEVMAIIKSCF